MSEDPDLIRLAMQMQSKEAAEPTPAEAPPPAPIEIPAIPPLPAATANIGLPQQTHVKETKTAEELAAMILADLRKMNGCPEAGVSVAVYGFNPWNCWLHFGAAAGPVNNKAELQEFCEIITERLKRLYDVFL